MKRMITSSLVITAFCVACGSDALDVIGGVLEDAGRIVRDAGANDAAAQAPQDGGTTDASGPSPHDGDGDAPAMPLQWTRVTCVEEESYTRTITYESGGRTTTMIETITTYGYVWEGEPEDWLYRNRSNYMASPCYPYNMPSLAHTYSCEAEPANPISSAFAITTGHPTTDGEGRLRVDCGRRTEQRTIVTNSLGNVERDDTTITPYDPTAYDYWIARM